MIQRRYYGRDGKAIVNIDYDHDHGAGKPHGHDWATVSPSGSAFDRKREGKRQMKTKIVSYKGYIAGWLDSSIHDFLEALSPKGASTKYALITCLDSNPKPASLRDKSPELRSISRKLQIVGNGLLVPTRLLLETELKSPIFFGFDELSFFPQKGIEPKPESASLVGPARLSQARFKKFGKWMLANACSMALGGGEGLNFVVRARGLVKSLLGYTLEQPEPASAT